ncbi:MAG TPA: response regulator transcription factor [Sphingobacterium sp.]|nr:response regulator transcription factor [Sphingobacterium sp.]
MIKIILAEDHHLVRNGIKLLLNEQENIEVIAEMGNGHDALNFMRNESTPDILITDLNMPDMDGWRLAENIRKEFPSVGVIALSMLDRCEDIRAAFDCGVKAYLLKNVNYDEFLFAINYVNSGGRYICEELSMMFLEKTRKQTDFESSSKKIMREKDISERELEVLQLIGEGYTNTEIANRIFLSKRTIEGHRQNLIHKTDTKNTASLVRFAVLNGLIN